MLNAAITTVCNSCHIFWESLISAFMNTAHVCGLYLLSSVDEQPTLANVRCYDSKQIYPTLILRLATVWALAITYVPRTQKIHNNLLGIWI